MKTHPAFPALIAVLISGALMSQSAAQITVGSDGPNTTDSTSYSGAQTLTKVGTNTVTLTGDSSYTGVTTINGGTLLLDKTAGAQLYSGPYLGLSSAVTVNSGATFQTWNWNYGASNALSRLMVNYSAIVLNGGRVVMDDTFSADRAFTVGANGATLETTAGNTYTKVAVTDTPANQEAFSIRFTANSNLTVEGEGNTVINDALGAFGNTGFSITKNGTGTLTLGGNNTYTGGTVVDDGTLFLTGKLANNASAAITVNNGGTVTLARQDTLGSHNANIATPIVLNDGGVLQNSGAVFNALGALTLNGGTLAANGVEANSGQSFALKGTVTVNGSATSTISGSGIGLGAGSVTGTTFVVNDGAAAADLLVTGVLRDGAGVSWPTTQASSLTKNGNGTMVLANNNTYTGTTTINAGVLQVGNGGTTGSLGSGTINNNGVLAFDRSNAISVGNAISGTGALVQNGTGTTTLTGANTYTGGTTVNSGTLVIGSGGTLANNAGNTLTIGNGGTVTFARTDVFGVHSTAKNTPIVIEQGGVLQNSGAVFNALGALTLNGGTLAANGVGADSGQSFALKGTVTVNGSATSTISGAGIALGAGSVTGTTFVVNDGAAAADLLVTGVLRDGAGLNWPTPQASSLTKNGLGTMVLSGNNTYSGETTINSGVLQVGNGGTTGSLGNGTINNKGVLAFNRSDAVSLGNNWASFDGLGGVFTLRNEGAGLVTISDSAKNIGAINGDGVTFVLDGTGRGQIDQSVASGGADMAIRKTGTGTWTLANVANNYTGSTTITAGTLEVTGRLGAGNYAQAIANDGELHINTTSEQVISGDISGTGQLRKSSAGTLTLSGNNTYTGATSVQAGELNVNGSIAGSAVSVGSGASLSGSGTVGAISGAGSINPGNSPGILTAPSVDPRGGLSFNFEFTSLNPTYSNSSASVNDVLRLTAATPFVASLGAVNTVNIYFNVDVLEEGQLYTGGFFTDTQTDFLSQIVGATFNYYVQDAGGSYSALGEGLAIELTTINQRADFAGGDIDGQVVQFEVIPEPSTYALLVLGAAALGAHAWRRRRSAADKEAA